MKILLGSHYNFLENKVIKEFFYSVLFHFRLNMTGLKAQDEHFVCCVAFSKTIKETGTSRAK